MGRDRLPDGSLHGADSAGWLLSEAYAAAVRRGDIPTMRQVLIGASACVRHCGRLVGFDRKTAVEITREALGNVGTGRELRRRDIFEHPGNGPHPLEKVVEGSIITALCEIGIAAENPEGYAYILEFAVEEEALHAVWTQTLGWVYGNDMHRFPAENIEKADEARQSASSRCKEIAEIALRNT